MGYMCDKNTTNRKQLLWFYVFLALSVVSCKIFRNQSYWLSFMADYTSNFLILGSFFFLAYYKIAKDVLLTCLKKAYICFLVIYFVQFVLYPTEITTLLVSNEQEHRIRLYGQIIGSLGFFYYLNRSFLYKEKIDIMLAIAGYIFIFTLGFRMMLLSSAISAALMYFRLFKVSTSTILKAIALIAVVVTALYYIPFTNKIIGDMMERSASGQTYDNEDYIRYVQLEYFFNNHFNSIIEQLLGSGIPNSRSNYGMYMQVDIDDYSSTAVHGWVDWGLLGLSWMMGPITTLLFLSIIFKNIYISWKNSGEDLFIAIWYAFLLIICINNIELFRHGSMIFHAFILQYINDLNKQNEYTY